MQPTRRRAPGSPSVPAPAPAPPCPRHPSAPGLAATQEPARGPCLSAGPFSARAAAGPFSARAAAGPFSARAAAGPFSARAAAGPFSARAAAGPAPGYPCPAPPATRRAGRRPCAGRVAPRRPRRRPGNAAAPASAAASADFEPALCRRRTCIVHRYESSWQCLRRNLSRPARVAGLLEYARLHAEQLRRVAARVAAAPARLGRPRHEGVQLAQPVGQVLGVGAAHLPQGRYVLVRKVLGLVRDVPLEHVRDLPLPAGRVELFCRLGHPVDRVGKAGGVVRVVVVDQADAVRYALAQLAVYADGLGRVALLVGLPGVVNDGAQVEDRLGLLAGRLCDLGPVHGVDHCHIVGARLGGVAPALVPRAAVTPLCPCRCRDRLVDPLLDVLVVERGGRASAAAAAAPPFLLASHACKGPKRCTAKNAADRRDGPAGIRTPGLRRVRATS